MQLAELGEMILDNACGNPSDIEGCTQYRIEAHCMAFIIDARINQQWIEDSSKVKWEVERVRLEAV